MSKHLLPTPAEDEFALGYLGRLTHLNGINSAESCLHDLRKSFGIPAAAAFRLKTVAQAARQNCSDFLRTHTIAPAIVCGKDVSRGLVGGNLSYRCPDVRNPMRLFRSNGYFCEDCVIAQRDKNGFGYWHRVHQLPGIYWCPWHKRPLFKCDGNWVTEKLPSWRLDVTETATEVCDAIGHPTLNRYNEVIMKFLYHPCPIDELALLALLTKAAEKRGVKTWKWEPGSSLLSDIVFESIPAWWLRDVCSVSEKVHGEFFREIDDAVNAARVGTQVYALAAAILLDEDNLDINEARRSTPLMCVD